MPNTHFTKQYNKVVIAGDTIIDLSADTVAAGLMLAKDGSNNNVTAHDKNGAIINGSIQTKSSSDVTVPTTGTDAGKAVVAAGYYPSEVKKAMTAAVITLNDPSITPTNTITKSSDTGHVGEIKSAVSGSGTVSATVGTAGFVSSVSDTGAVGVSGTTYKTAESIESNLTGANVRYGATIFKTTGAFSYEADYPATAGDILAPAVAFVNGAKVEGSMTNRSSGGDVEMSLRAGVSIPAGYYDGSVSAVLDTASYNALIPNNIRLNTEILGVTGALDPSSEVTKGTGTATPKFSATANSYQTIMPSSISKDYFDEFHVMNIVPTEALTGTTTGYTLTISNTFV